MANQEVKCCSKRTVITRYSALLLLEEINDTISKTSVLAKTKLKAISMPI